MSASNIRSAICFLLFYLLSSCLALTPTQIDSTEVMKSGYHVVGGGPVGFAMALMLAKEGIPSVVYERNPEGVK